MHVGLNQYSIIEICVHIKGPPFLLTKPELKLADDRVMKVIVPTGYGWNPRPFFTKRCYLKSHDWKQVNNCSKFCLKAYK